MFLSGTLSFYQMMCHAAGSGLFCKNGVFIPGLDCFVSQKLTERQVKSVLHLWEGMIYFLTFVGANRIKMEYKILVNNPWQENTVVLYDETGEAAVLDCGCFTREEAKRLQDFLSGAGLKPVLLLNTHLHPDHVFGNRFMSETYGLAAQASEADEFLLEHTVEYAAMLGLRGASPAPALGGHLKDGDTVRFGASELEVIAVPGHSPGGLCYYNRKDGLLLSGDVLFAGSVGRSDLPGGDGDALVAGIRSRLLTLPDDVRVIPGHGPATTIGEERNHNPFL